MLVSTPGSSARMSGLTLYRTIQIVSPATTFGATLWRQGFLYTIEWRIVPTASLRVAGPYARWRAVQHTPTERETATDLATAAERFEQIVAEQPTGLAPSGVYVRPDGMDDGTLARAVLSGAEPAPEELAMAELVRQIYPAVSGSAREAILGFVRDAPLTLGCWSGWKWLYKQAEATTDIELLATAVRRLRAGSAWLRPEYPTPVPFINRYPSPQTVRYLRRRMARYERNLAVADPEASERLRSAILAPVDEVPTKATGADLDTILATLTSRNSTAVATAADLYWSADLSSCESLLATLGQSILPGETLELSLIEAIIRWMPAAPRDEHYAGRRASLMRWLGEHFDTPQPEATRITIANCIWQTDDEYLHRHARMALIQAANDYLPAWVSAVRVAVPPDLRTILNDVEARIRDTIWKPADVRILAPLIRSFGAPDLVERVADLAPDTFQEAGMGLTELFNHPISNVAVWARRQAIDTGLPGAEMLRLIESRRDDDHLIMVSSVSKLRADDPDLLACVQRLLGDARPRLRRLGVTLAQTHQSTLPVQPALVVLAATSDRAAWSLALDLLEQEPDVIADVPRLVVAALRERWATPRQRAAITQQIEAAPRQCQEIVLAIARTGYPVQREWALRILINLAKDGVMVPGVELIELQEAGR